MANVSVIIPSRNELFLAQTIDSIFGNATGDIEVIAVLDGWWPDPPLEDDKRLKIIHRGNVRGMRDGINSAAAIATGRYLLKCDAHCIFGPGFDEILEEDCDDNWIVIPRRYSLQLDTWERAPKEHIDAMYYFWPYEHPDDLGLHGRPWYHRGRERTEILIDEDVTFQGSCWFMHAEHYRRIGGLSEIGYETFMGEPQEIGFKTQLGPWEGKVMRNKKTWYAHLHKGHQTWKNDENMSGRVSGSERYRGNAFSFDMWWRNRWEGRAHNIEWLLERFQPMPGWPIDWLEKKASGVYG